VLLLLLPLCDMCLCPQEQQVPVHARVIAGSATTSILTNQVVAQQYELQKVEKRMEDMKAALHLACGVLRQTNYMDEQVGGVGLSAAQHACELTVHNPDASVLTRSQC
jgi:hypothetical protein